MIMKYRVGIIGAGHIANKFTSACAILPGVTVAAVASRSADRASAFATKNGIDGVYSSYQEMLEKEHLDLVYIATTNNFHFECCSIAAEYGVNMLVEKPFMMSVKDAETILDTAGRKGIFVMEGMWSRFLPAIRKAREWVAEGAIGVVRSGTYTAGINPPEGHRVRNPELGGGALYDIGVYPLEIIPYILSETPHDVTGMIHYDGNGIDDRDVVSLEFSSSFITVNCTIDAAVHTPFVLYGDKGSIAINDTFKAQSVSRYDLDGKLVETFDGSFQNGFEFEIAEALECVSKDLTESPVIPWSDTLWTAGVFDKLLSK